MFFFVFCFCFEEPSSKTCDVTPHDLGVRETLQCYGTRSDITESQWIYDAMYTTWSACYSTVFVLLLQGFSSVKSHGLSVPGDWGYGAVNVILRWNHWSCIKRVVTAPWRCKEQRKIDVRWWNIMIHLPNAINTLRKDLWTALLLICSRIRLLRCFRTIYIVL